AISSADIPSIAAASRSRNSDSFEVTSSRMLSRNSNRNSSFPTKGQPMKRLVLILLSLATVCGCPSPANQEEQKPQPPEALTGRSAFQRLYVSAHGWAGDARPYQLQSQVFGDNKGTDGKAPIWRASFGSATQHSSKPYMWSGVDSPDAPSRGV